MDDIQREQWEQQRHVEESFGDVLDPWMKGWLSGWLNRGLSRDKWEYAFTILAAIFLTSNGLSAARRLITGADPGMAWLDWITVTISVVGIAFWYWFSLKPYRRIKAYDTTFSWVMDDGRRLRLKQRLSRERMLRMSEVTAAELDLVIQSCPDGVVMSDHLLEFYDIVPRIKISPDGVMETIRNPALKKHKR